MIRQARRRILAAAALACLPQAVAKLARGTALPQVGWLLINVSGRDFAAGGRGAVWASAEAELRRLGWTDGKTLNIHFRTAAGDWSTVARTTKELLAIPVDVLVTFGIGLDEAILQTKTTPIVSNLGWDREGTIPANVTGVNISHWLLPKSIWLLKDLSPLISTVGVAFDARADPTGELTAGALKDLSNATARKSLHLVPIRIASFLKPEAELDAALKAGVQAICVKPTNGLHLPEYQYPIHEWARRRRIPVVHGFTTAAETGGLMGFGQSVEETGVLFARSVDKVLRGVKPADLPMEEPTKYDLIINLSAAKSIGLTIPAALLLQATRIIE